MDSRAGREIQYQPFASLVQAPSREANPLHLVPDDFGAVVQTFTTGLFYAVGFGRDLVDSDFGFAAVVEVKGRFKSDALETGRPVCVPLFGDRFKERDQVRLKLRGIDNAGAQCVRYGACI